MRREINISNYEEWFIDHIDGTLNDEETLRLEEFLQTHPELREELDSFESIILEPCSTSITAEEKSQLKHPELDDEAIISMMESGESLTNFLDPSEALLLGQYARTRLQYDTRITYPDSASLKKRDAVIIPLWFRASAIAASLFFAMLLLLPDPAETSYVQREGQPTAWENTSDTPDEQIFASESIAPANVQHPSPLPFDKAQDLIPASQKEEAPSWAEKEKDQKHERALEQEEPKPLLTELPIEKIAVKEVDEPALAEVQLETPSHPKHSPVSEGLKENRPATSALDILKKITANSDVLAIQDANEHDPYIEGSMSIGSFSLSIKRKRK